MSKALTDSEVELEIASLNNDPDVGLARAEHRAKYRRRQYLYSLRYFKKRGEELRKSGMTEETFKNLEKQCADAEIALSDDL